jgi:AraC-like DNA-binding protein
VETVAMTDPAAQPALHPVPAVSAAAMTARKLRKPRTFTTAHLRRLDRAADVYLQDCYRNRTAARTSEFAQFLGVQPQYISGIAPKILGMPLRIFLRKKQLAMAVKLLRRTPLTVEEIAVRCAFGTPSTFYRWFVAAYKVTPAAFRELKK